MKKILYLMLFLTSTIAFSQSDEDFSYVTSDVKNNDYYVYIEKTNYSTVDAWIKKVEPIKTIKNKKGKIVKTGGGHTLQFIQMNCSEREFDIKESITYNKNGEVVSSNDYPSYNNKVVPGTVMAGILKAICNTD